MLCYIVVWNVSLTEIEPIWFEMENSLPNCVKKACQFINCLHFFALLSNLFSHLKLLASPNE